MSAPNHPLETSNVQKELTTYNLKIATPNRTPKPKRDGKPCEVELRPLVVWGGSKHDEAGGKTEFLGKAARRDGAPRWRHDVAAACPAKRKKTKMCRVLHQKPHWQEAKIKRVAKIGVFPPSFLFGEVQVEIC